MNKPEVIQSDLWDMQVCVPEEWTDEQAIAFAESKHPCGTEHGWQIVARLPCKDHENYIHIVLDA